MGFEQVGVVGLGLIGGSLALALRQKTGLRVMGFDRDGDTLAQARRAGAIDGAPDTPAGCGLLLVALYPGAAVEYVKKAAPHLPEGAWVVDLCGIKRYVAGELAPLCAGRGLCYLGAHPMAGKETSGFQSASAGLFNGASLILTGEVPAREAPALAQFEGIMRRVGFLRFVRTTPEYHDRMIAYTSQLAHVLSSAYIQNPLALKTGGFTGGSFQDLTRVSRLNGEMWGELFFKNSDMLVEQLDILLGFLESYKRALIRQDEGALWALMENGTATKNTLLARAGDAASREGDCPP